MIPSVLSSAGHVFRLSLTKGEETTREVLSDKMAEGFGVLLPGLQKIPAHAILMIPQE